MRFWFREIAGWLLVLLGVGVFYLVFLLLYRDEPPGLLQSGPLVVIGIILFRGGIHLLKVAVAARICLQAQERTADPRKPPARPAPTVMGSRTR